MYVSNRAIGPGLVVKSPCRIAGSVLSQVESILGHAMLRTGAVE